MKAQGQPPASGQAEATGKGSAGEAPLAEWLVALLGLGLALGSIGFLLFQALIITPGPPDISLEASEPIATQYGYLLPVTVRNDGGETVAGLSIEARLEQGGEALETSQTSLDYVPAHSTQQAGFFFAEDPRDFELVLHIGGYQEP